MDEYLKNISGTLFYLIQKDWYLFNDSFPGYAWYLFFVLRLAPWLLLLAYAFYRLLSPWHSTIINTVERAYHQLPKANNMFWLIFLLAATLRIWFAISIPLMADEGDAMSRLEMAVDWYKHPYPTPGGLIWLPLHFYLLMVPAFAGVNPITAGWVSTLVFGLATFPLLYFFIRKKFGETNALISCLLLAVSPFHIKYSVLSMTEIPFLFFVIAACWCLYKYIENEKLLYLIVAGICLNCCNLIRFEGWMLSALLPLFLVFYRKKLRAVVLLYAVSSVSILWYLFTSYTTTGYLVYGLTMSDREVRFAYDAVLAKAHHVVQGFMWDEVYQFWLLPFWLYGLWLGWKQKKEVPLLMLCVILLSAITWKVFRWQSEPSWRYFSVGMFLSIPYLSLCLLKLTSSSSVKRAAVFCLLILAMLAKTTAKYVQLKYNSGTGKDFFETAAWIKTHRAAGEKIIYQTAGFTFSGFRLAADIPAGEMYYPHYAGMKKFDGYEAFDAEVLQRLIRDKDYRWIVAAKGCAVDSFLNSSALAPVTTHCVKQEFVNNQFAIYSISH